MSLVFGYYPGCSGLGTSLEYDRSTRAVCRELGVSLQEIPDWNCCGSTPAHTVDEALSAALSARIFAQGESVGLADFTTPCPSCLKNLRNALDRMEEPFFKARVEALTERPLRAAHSVRSVLQVLVEDLGLEAVAARVRRPLTGLKLVPYYGCLMNRPAESMRFDDPENPTAMDKLLEALGAEVLPFPLKVDCCGASFAIPERESVPRLAGRILELAASMGADAVVVACPLCQMNLDLRQGQIRARKNSDYHLPVPYFTQLMAYAFGLTEADAAFGKLVVPMRGAFACMERRAAEAARAAEEAAAREAAKQAAKQAARTDDADAKAAGAADTSKAAGADDTSKAAGAADTSKTAKADDTSKTASAADKGQAASAADKSKTAKAGDKSKTAKAADKSRTAKDAKAEKDQSAGGEA